MVLKFEPWGDDPVFDWDEHNQEKMIIFRPHHFMCSLSFSGYGYSAEFVANYAKIVELLRQDENIAILVSYGGDSICSACYKMQEDGNCESQPKIEKLDRSYAEILDLKNGDIISWKDAKLRIKANVTLEKFHKACEDCEWKKLGICENSLEALVNCN